MEEEEEVAAVRVEVTVLWVIVKKNVDGSFSNISHPSSANQPASFFFILMVVVLDLFLLAHPPTLPNTHTHTHTTKLFHWSSPPHQFPRLIYFQPPANLLPPYYFSFLSNSYFFYYLVLRVAHLLGAIGCSLRASNSPSTKKRRLSSVKLINYRSRNILFFRRLLSSKVALSLTHSREHYLACIICLLTY